MGSPCPSNATSWSYSTAAGSSITAASFNEIINAINAEATRRGGTLGIANVSAGNAVSGALVSLMDTTVTNWGFSVTYPGTGTVINASNINSGVSTGLKYQLNQAQMACPCNCDYACTCNCNYSCTCNCNYCTCNCNYCTCNCNYCTCNCNYACTCNCNYACTCNCNYACTCDCNYSSCICNGDASCVSCPAPEVPVLLASGEEVTAGDIKVGDTVVAWDDVAKELVVDIVIFHKLDTNDRLLLTLDNGRSGKFAFNHKFLTASGDWVKLCDLIIGQELTNGIKVSNITPDERGPVVFMTVKNTHTYMTLGVVSHNRRKVAYD